MMYNIVNWIGTTVGCSSFTGRRECSSQGLTFRISKTNHWIFLISSMIQFCRVHIILVWRWIPWHPIICITHFLSFACPRMIPEIFTNRQPYFKLNPWKSYTEPAVNSTSLRWKLFSETLRSHEFIEHIFSSFYPRRKIFRVTIV